PNHANHRHDSEPHHAYDTRHTERPMLGHSPDQISKPCCQRQHHKEGAKANHQTKNKQAVPLVRKLLPRNLDLGLVQRHTMKKHEMPPAAEPKNHKPNCHGQHYYRHGDRGNPPEILQNIMPRAFEGLPDTSTYPAPRGSGPIIIASMETALTEVGQPRAETDHKPSSGVQRLKENALDAFDRLADGLSYADI